MHYNELKILVLGLFDPKQELESPRIRTLLLREKGVRATDKAIEMALMRYSRQGLLSRNRRNGLFYYRLTEKGASRLVWLLKNSV
jgi:DNA-binding PadR family transcriptional regulator